MQNPTLPYDTQAEVGLIGSIILHPEFAAQLNWFQVDHLYYNENKCLYWAVAELLKDGVTNIDDFNIIKKINEHSGVRSIFEGLKIPPLQVLIDEYKAVARDTFEEYTMLVKRVTNLAYRRKAYDVAMSFSELCLKDDNDSLSSLNQKFHDDMNKLTEKFIVNQEIQLIGEIIDAKWNEILEQRQNGLIGIPSKYDLINEYFTYQNGELYVIGGRAKAGKSTFFLNEIHHKLKLGLSCAIFDTEMTTRRLLPRMLALESGLTIKEIERGTYKGDLRKEKALTDAFMWWKAQKFVHIYEPSWTFDKIYASAKLLKIRKDFNLNFLVFDYIKMTNTIDSNGEKMNYFLGTFTDFLKNRIAGELDIPVLAGAQMSPYDTRLADSDSIQRYASVIAYWVLKDDKMIKRDNSQESGNYKAIVDLNRLGNNHSKEDNEGINFDFVKDKCLIELAPYQPLRNAMNFNNLSER